jgi:hypothetical protein
VLLSTKDGELATIKNVQVVAERKSDRQWHALCIDCGGEFTANDFKEYFMELGVQCQLTMPYSSPQNGIIERRNQTLMGAAHSMLKAKDLSITFWGGGVMMVVYVLNRSMSKGARGRIPYELWTGSTPSVEHLHTFRCMAHVKDTHPDLQKLEDRSKPMIFVGYEAGSMAYRAYNLTTKRIHISRDVVFDEEVKWSWGYDKIDSEFIVKHVEGDQQKVVITCQGGQEVNPVLGVGAAAPRSITPTGEHSPVLGAGAASPHTVSPGGEQVSLGPTVMHASPTAGGELDLDADHDGEAPLQFHTLQNINLAGPTLRLIQQELGADLLVVNTEELMLF